MTDETTTSSKSSKLTRSIRSIKIVNPTKKYEPIKESLGTHKPPQWFMDAKLGIFIHWGIYSVPAWAPIAKKQGLGQEYTTIQEHMLHNPYAEWYLNSLRFKDGPYQKHHEEVYGKDFPYEKFADEFNEAIKKWSPSNWSEFFKKIHAKYVVITSKHHDGFLLWPSDHPNPNPNLENYSASRDIIGELTDEVKAKGLKMGIYYSGVIDWSFDENVIDSGVSFINTGCTDQNYADYADAHWYELINKYEPSIVWNDIGYPKKGKMEEIFAYYYNNFPDGVVNDRWDRSSNFVRNLVKFPGIKQLVNWGANSLFRKGMAAKKKIAFGDFLTPEYQILEEIQPLKWESCRGLGQSFGYNQLETEEHYIAADELIRSFIDIVSKNGNLLINIGPKPDGTIPEPQIQRLTALGKWLDVNGEAIFGTTPWQKAASTATTADISIDVRFTAKPELLYVHLLGIPKKSQIIINEMNLKSGATIQLLGDNSPISWENDGGSIKLTLSHDLQDYQETPAIVFKITLS
ncbi:MAG: alpha-L-fucosidase [Promethearchaeota archaeon]